MNTEHFATIDSWLAKHGPPVSRLLKPGNPDASSENGLPESLSPFYTWHDGTDPGTGLLGHCYLVPGWILLSASECAREREAGLADGLWTGGHVPIFGSGVGDYLKHRRQKYRCRCGAAPVTAPGPLKLPGGGRYSLDFAIDAAVSKSGYHLPWERQATMMGREGLNVDSMTLWEQNERFARLLLATFEALRAYVVSGQLIHADETTWRLMRKNARSYWVWVFGRHDAVVYAIEPSRGHKVALDVLKDFRGVLMADGWSAYKTLAQKLSGQLVLGGCWVHGRRGFKLIVDDHPECREVLDLIGQLFLIERDLPRWEVIQDPRLQRQALEYIREVRQRESKPLVCAIRDWRKCQQVLSRGAFGDALGYLKNHWVAFTRFLHDPRIPLDINRAERAMRGPVLGRKNFGGCRSLRGLEVAGLLYSLIESAKLVNVDPRRYLRAAAEAALRGEAPLLPHAYRA